MAVIIFLASLSYRLVHCKKGFPIFPSPAGMSLTKLSLDGNYDVIYKLFLHRESLVSDIPAGDGNIEKLFYSVVFQTAWFHIRTTRSTHSRATCIYSIHTSQLKIEQTQYTDKKKKTKFSSYIRKFRWDRLQRHIQYEEGLPNM